jgi:hypothetical protein
VIGRGVIRSVLFVLIFWADVASVLSAGSWAMGHGVIAQLTRGAGAGRRKPRDVWRPMDFSTCLSGWYLLDLRSARKTGFAVSCGDSSGIRQRYPKGKALRSEGAPKSSGDIREPAYGPKSAPSSAPGPVFLSIPGWASGRCLNRFSSVSRTRSASQEKWRSAVRERQTVTRRLHVTEASCSISHRFTRTIL